MQEIDKFEQEVRSAYPSYCKQIVRRGLTVYLLFDVDPRLVSEPMDDVVNKYTGLKFVDSLGGNLRKERIEGFGFTYHPDMEEWDDMTIYGIGPK